MSAVVIALWHGHYFLALPQPPHAPPRRPPGFCSTDTRQGGCKPDRNLAPETTRTTMMRVWFAVLSTLIMTVVILAWTLAAPSQTNGALSVTAKPGEWRYLNADPQSTRYSPLDQITKDNFKHLKIAWRWKPAIGRAPLSLGGTAQTNGDPTLARYKNEATPIIANGILYESAGAQRVVAALDAATGKQLWLWNGVDENGRDRKAPRRNAGRGVGYWTDGLEERIFVVTTGFYLVALNAKTGTPVQRVWRQRRCRSDEGAEFRLRPRLANRQQLAAHGLSRHGHRSAGPRRGLRAALDAQHAWLCDGVRRAHRQAEMGISHRAEEW